ncbi:hypothetical protein VNO78_25062 [Psophocarpus tetragonolobus]|uniref:Uncharacterized protein n=1 Tax=Psophocarpus tetragonolobus TaxID=3891 RepID=A0AAN9S8T7_PSOTE
MLRCSGQQEGNGNKTQCLIIVGLGIYRDLLISKDLSRSQKQCLLTVIKFKDMVGDLVLIKGASEKWIQDSLDNQQEEKELDVFNFVEK